jgi:hypothetical protein
MKRFGGLFAHLGLAGMLVAGVAFGQAQPKAHPNSSLDKHARKIQHKLAKYQGGRYLHLVLSDDSNAYGEIGALSNASFTFTNADSNSVATYNYDDVNKVKTDKEPIGAGTEPRRHIRHLVPIVIGAAAVGAGAAVYQAER